MESGNVDGYYLRFLVFASRPHHSGVNDVIVCLLQVNAAWMSGVA